MSHVEGGKTGERLGGDDPQPCPFSLLFRLILSHAPQAQAVTPKFVQQEQELSYCHLSVVHC